MGRFSLWLESKDKSKEGAGIFFVCGNKVLLLKRAEEGYEKGHWCIPGGRLKIGELPLTGAKREAQEECGHSQGTKLGQFVHYTATGFRFTTFLFRVPNQFPVRLSHEHSDSQWVDLIKLNSIKLTKEFKKGLPEAFEIISSR